MDRAERIFAGPDLHTCLGASAKPEAVVRSTDLLGHAHSYRDYAAETGEAVAELDAFIVARLYESQPASCAVAAAPRA
jgi:hypothetical protein